MGIISLTTAQVYNSLGNDINIIGTFSSGLTDTEKHVSPSLLNYVEPYEHLGAKKTLFYTEVNTSLKAGDRAFISNGNYDSAALISRDKYKKGSDGYRVLFVDRCAVALDIDYTGKLPIDGPSSSGESLADYIKIFAIESHDALISATKQITTRGGEIRKKFEYYQNNIAYIGFDAEEILSDGWSYMKGVTASPGFYVMNPADSSWTNITDRIMAGSYSLASSDSAPLAQNRYYVNGKAIVDGGSFAYGGSDFADGSVYRWDASSSKWSVVVEEQVKFARALITKASFRKGIFKGSFNAGIYGSREEKIEWTGDGTWNGGTLFNALWKRGSMRSLISLSESHSASIRGGVPYQRANTYNNGGYGFNFIIDTDFDQGSIYGSIVRNTTFGGKPTLSAVKNYLTGATQSFDKQLYGGLYESCRFNNTLIEEAAVKNSRSARSLFKKTKHISSFAKDSVFVGSTIIADPVIKIDGYDELTASSGLGPGVPAGGPSHKVFKFYIGEADYLKLSQGDSFYLKGIRIKDDAALLNLFDRKFTIGSWTEYFDHFSGDDDIDGIGKGVFYKRGVRCAAFLSTPEDNEWLHYSVEGTSGYSTEAIEPNPNPRYSIDIFISTKDINGKLVEGISLDYANLSISSSSIYMPARNNRVDISSAYVIDSDIDGGIIDSSSIASGSYISDRKDLVINAPTGSSISPAIYDIEADRSTGDLLVRTQVSKDNLEIVDRTSTFREWGVKKGDILHIDTLDHYARGKVLSVSIAAGGSGYGANPEVYPVYAPTASGSGVGLKISNQVSGGTVSSVQIISGGVDYREGDLLALSVPGQGQTDAAYLVVESVATDSTRLPSSYEISSIDINEGKLRLSPLGPTSSIIGLTSGGIFTAAGAENRWGSLSRLKISKSRIRSGLFKGALMSGCTILDDSYDVNDKDFGNISKIKNLVVADSIFSGGGNTLSMATYYNTIILGGTDIWDNGIAYNSFLKGVVFRRGIVKDSAWADGIFEGGLFYMSKSFDAKPSEKYPIVSSNRIFSHYMGGRTYTGTQSIGNNRHSWRSGQFNGGEFFSSDWEGGTFSGGLFYKSKWYGGTAEGGRFGNEETAMKETIFYSGTVNDTVVDNATFIANYASYLPAPASIQWNGGTFNGGVFGTDVAGASNSAVWNGGIFNGGQFVDYAVWKGGTFNGGQFKSGYGWTMSGSYSVSGPISSYSWQGGIFNGGEFGNGSIGKNSTWFTGEFNDGVFSGRVWNSGIFRYGTFKGSGMTAAGGWKIDAMDEGSSAQRFISSYASQDAGFYGLWRDGLVTDKNDIYVVDKKFYTEEKRSGSPEKKGRTAKFENVLWRLGRFENPDGTMDGSVWLAGRFSAGDFIRGSFNPYIPATSGHPVADEIGMRQDEKCIWSGGSLHDSDFFYSKWESGDFISGTAVGMLFKGGTSYYMNAYNCVWENGIWKNGNWNGSEFAYNGIISSTFSRSILSISSIRTSYNDIHIWNIFDDASLLDNSVMSATPSAIETRYVNLTLKDATKAYMPEVKI